MQQIQKAVQRAEDLHNLFAHEPLSRLVSMLAEDLMAVTEEYHKWKRVDMGKTRRLMEDIESLISRLCPTWKDLDYWREPIKGYLKRLAEIQVIQAAKKNSQLESRKTKGWLSLL